MTNSADPDQMASSEANWSGSILFAKTGHVVFSKRRANISLMIYCLFLLYIFLCFLVYVFAQYRKQIEEEIMCWLIPICKICLPFKQNRAAKSFGVSIPQGPGFKTCWRQSSPHDYMALHCREHIIIIIPSFWYDLNNIERDVETQIIIMCPMHITSILIIWQHFSFS